MTKQPNDKRRFMLLIFGFFLVVFAVNGVFMYYAFRSHPGVETENAYEKGLDYNAYLAEAEEAKELGWTYNLETKDFSGTTGISFQVLDASGTPLEGLNIRGKAFWPVKEGYDQLFELTEGSPGVYTAQVPLDLKGQWDFRFIILQGDEPKGYYTKRVLLR